MNDFMKYDPTTHPIVKLEDDYNSIVDHAFEKESDYIIRKKGTNTEIVYGYGSNQAGKHYNTPGSDSYSVIQDLLEDVVDGEKVYLKGRRTSPFELTDQLTCDKTIEFCGSRYSSILKPAPSFPDGKDMVVFSGSPQNSVIKGIWWGGIDLKPSNGYHLLKITSYYYSQILDCFFDVYGLTYPRPLYLGGDGGLVRGNVFLGNNAPFLTLELHWFLVTDIMAAQGYIALKGSNTFRGAISDFYLETPTNSGIKTADTNSGKKQIGISDGLIWKAQNHGIDLNTLTDLVLGGNLRIFDCGQSSPNTYDGVHLENVVDAVCNGIISKNVETSSQRYGFNAGVGCDWILADALNCHNNAHANYDIVLTGANSVLGTHIGRHE